MDAVTYEIVLKKTQMMDIVSVFKKAMVLGDQFILINDVINFHPDHVKVNGAHCIEHGIQFPSDEFRHIPYISMPDISDKLKTITNAKGLNKITLLWSSYEIAICLEYKDETDPSEYVLVRSVNKSSIEESENQTYQNLYKILSDATYDQQTMTGEQLKKIAAGKVVYLVDHNGGLIRISKNLFPCIGVVRKGTIPQMNVVVKTYTKGDNNILALLTQYKSLNVLHVYYYDPIMEEE